MSSFNRVILLGAAGRDAELRYSAEGAAIANVSLATSRRYKDSSGNLQEETEWHRLSLFGRLAEVAGEYVKRGKQIHVEGRLRTRKWQDSDGNDRYITEIVVDNLQLLGGGRAEEAAGTSASETAVASTPEPTRPATRSTAAATPATVNARAGAPTAATRGRTPGGRLARDKTAPGATTPTVATATAAALAAAAPGDLALMSDDIPF